MRKTLVLLMVFLLSGAALAGDTENPGNVLTAENVEINKGSVFPVKVLLANVDSLIAIQVPFYYRSEDVDLVCDSITFQGTRLAEQSLSFFKIEPVGKVAFFAFMSMTQLDPSKPMLIPGDGPIAVMWFTAGKEIKSGKVMLDSGPHVYYPHEWIDYSYHFWVKSTGEDVTRDVDCAYKPGYITVK